MGLYFDGRKDKTKVQIKKGTTFYNKTVTEEYVCLEAEPNNWHIGHISPHIGGAKVITEEIVKFLRKSKTNSNDLMAVGCDGTNANTGAVVGVIRLLEQQIGRPLQWFVGLLFANELTLRHLLQKLDGATGGPKTFSGPIGRALFNCEELPVTKFQSVTFENCPSWDSADLSNDQQYLYDMCQLSRIRWKLYSRSCI